jgi:hypothetical protein
MMTKHIRLDSEFSRALGVRALEAETTVFVMRANVLDEGIFVPVRLSARRVRAGEDDGAGAAVRALGVPLQHLFRRKYLRALRDSALECVVVHERDVAIECLFIDEYFAASLAFAHEWFRSGMLGAHVRWQMLPREPHLAERTASFSVTTTRRRGARFSSQIIRDACASAAARFRIHIFIHGERR